VYTFGEKLTSVAAADQLLCIGHGKRPVETSFAAVDQLLCIDHDDCGDHVISGCNVEKKNVIFLRGYKDWRRG
jgi:hypothetical protein